MHGAQGLTPLNRGRSIPGYLKFMKLGQYKHSSRYYYTLHLPDEYGYTRCHPLWERIARRINRYNMFSGPMGEHFSNGDKLTDKGGCIILHAAKLLACGNLRLLLLHAIGYLLGAMQDKRCEDGAWMVQRPLDKGAGGCDVQVMQLYS